MATTNILVQPPPKHSMSVYLNVSAGTNQRVQSLGSYSGYYPSISSVTESYNVIAQGQGWQGTKTGALFINTDTELVFTGVKAITGDTITMTIRRMLFIDQELDSWALINNTNQQATVFLCASTPVPYNVQPIGASVVSVNGNFPDLNGNVTVNTGVMTVDNTLPDANGNINTDESTFAP